MSYANTDSEDDSDPLPGTKVSTKRSSNSDYPQPCKKAFANSTARLPLPASFLDSHLNQPEHVDNPHSHGNRTRSFMHERGNWATFVYLPVDSSENFLNYIHNLLQHCNSDSLVLNKCEDLHISLTRTVVLRHHWIEDFVSLVRQNVAQVTRFQVHSMDVAVYVNEEKTRTFIGLQISDSDESLKKLVQTLNNCLNEYKLPSFYKDASFHVSIAWCLGDYKNKLESFLANCSFLPFDPMSFLITELKCKVGHIHFTCPLRLMKNHSNQ